MPYTEGLFTAFAAWSLWAVLKNRWLTAGAMCVLAGLTRPTATALIPVVCLAALVAIVKRRNSWRPYVALVIAPLGWLGYIKWVGDRTGRLDGWFHIQGEQWKMSFDGGVSTVQDVSGILARESAFELTLVTLTLVAAIALFVLSLIDRQPWQLLLYSGLLLVDGDRRLRLLQRARPVPAARVRAAAPAGHRVGEDPQLTRLRRDRHARGHLGVRRLLPDPDLEVLALARRRSHPPPWRGSRPAPVAGQPSGASRGVRR